MEPTEEPYVAYVPAETVSSASTRRGRSRVCSRHSAAHQRRRAIVRTLGGAALGGGAVLLLVLATVLVRRCAGPLPAHDSIAGRRRDESRPGRRLAGRIAAVSPAASRDGAALAMRHATANLTDQAPSARPMATAPGDRSPPGEHYAMPTAESGRDRPSESSSFGFSVHHRRTNRPRQPLRSSPEPAADACHSARRHRARCHRCTCRSASALRPLAAPPPGAAGAGDRTGPGAIGPGNQPPAGRVATPSAPAAPAAPAPAVAAAGDDQFHAEQRRGAGRQQVGLHPRPLEPAGPATV